MGPGRLPDQTAAEEKPWRWSDEKAEARSSIEALGDRYKARIENPRDGGGRRITLSREGDDAYSWDGHEHSVFVVAGDVLYLADFSEFRSGCAVLARDLRAGKDLWRTDLQTIPIPGHSQYSNRINLEVDDRHLTVYGSEAAGRYLELLDLKSGKVVGYRLIDVADGLVPKAE